MEPFIKKQKINDFKVVHPDLKTEDKPPFIEGVVEKPTPFIGIVGPKGRGKSTIIYNIILKWLNERNELYFKRKAEEKAKEEAARREYQAKGVKFDPDKIEDTDFKNSNDLNYRRLYEILHPDVPAEVYVFSATAKMDPLYKDLTKKIKVKIPNKEELLEKLVLNPEVLFDARDRDLHLNPTLQQQIKRLVEENKGPLAKKQEFKEVEIDNPFCHATDNPAEFNQILDYILKNSEKTGSDKKDILLILDDMSEMIKRNRKVEEFVKINRHCCAFGCSSQYIMDFPRGVRVNMDYLCAMADIDEEKRENIHSELGLIVPLEVFHRLYSDATQEIGNFLFIDSQKHKIRQNFDEEYDLSGLNPRL